MALRSLILSVLFLTNLTWAQEPVLWSTKATKVSENTYVLTATAKIEENWHLYSQFLPDEGALATEFTFNNSEGNYELIEGVTESESITSFDEVFQMELTYFENKAIFTQHIQLLNNSISTIEALVAFQACDDKVCIFNEAALIFDMSGASRTQVQDDLVTAQTVGENPLLLDIKNKTLLKTAFATDSGGAGEAFWSLFVLGFLGGLLALLTPCVFPMIPLTVSYFTKHSGTRREGVFHAITYGFFIAMMYVVLSVPFHFLDNLDPEILNTISTNVWLNVFFFAIFIFFAFSFFGFYELTLPASWANKMDSSSSKFRGLLGIFFMANTLAIVSFSCTGPILGSLLAGSLTSEGGAWQLTAGMSGFGVALALPFVLFALFPNWLKSLPKSGNWMNTTKVVLGFLELALALKFLSNADLVAHWGLLKRELFIGLWVLIFAGLTIYLFGKWRFPHQAPSKISNTRRIFAWLFLIFTLYLSKGLLPHQNGRLRLLSGFPPPTFYSLYPQESDCPLGLNCYKDFETGRQAAITQNKPMLIDFTGWACVNCRKMEENVWSDPEVFELLNEKFVIVSLYVDDRKKLPKDAQFDIQFRSGRVKRIETVGQKWATFQALNFGVASQPYYVQMLPDGTILKAPQQYTDVVTFKTWLSGE